MMRFPEIDMARGVGILLMMIYHFFFDLSFFGISPLLSNPLVLIIGRLAAGLLILVSGISLSVSMAKWKGRPGSTGHHFRRFLLLLGVAALITLATWIYPHDGFIFFGIIHFLILAMVLGWLLAPSQTALKLITVLSVPAWLILQTQTTGDAWLSILGMHTTIYTLDLFSLFPWIGMFTMGMLAGNAMYGVEKRKFVLGAYTEPGGLCEMGKQAKLDWLCWMGRNSLIIYLLHQPLLFALFFLIRR